MMELGAYRIIGDLHMSTRFVGDDCVIEYHNKNNERHRGEGPAIIANLAEDKNEYCEWWSEGKLIAIFNKNKEAFLKSQDGTHDTLYKVTVPEKWKASELNLSLNEIGLFN